ncbi:MAG: rfbN [Deltaproteobacteria bacterium]|nr:rfbN [Deltaproteobacteria bacterium]
MEEPYRIDPIPDASRPGTLSRGISVIVPVMNGGEALAELFRKIRSQKKVEEVEIIVLDSGSTDDSAAIAESFGCRVIGIPREEFNHGATRNVGAGQAKGDYLVFTVQDAVPVSDYWLYAMASPFRWAPDLGAVSARQFTRPEADLFSLWTNDAVNAMIGLERDSVYGLSPSFDFSGWNRLDPLTKRRASFVDDVSSCIPKSAHGEAPFRSLANAEDIDLGIRMLEKGKRLGYLTSTGVFHWHDRGPDYFLKRSYIGTKANVHVLKNPLPRFFEERGIDRQTFLSSVAGLLDLVALAAPEPEAVDPEPMKTAVAFGSSFRRHFDSSPEEVSAALKGTGVGCRERLEAACSGVFGNARLLPEERHRFRKNFLVPHFLREVGNFTGFLARSGLSGKGRAGEFGTCIQKIFASVVGEAAGAFYLESETRGRLTEDLERTDRLLAKGVCRS